MRKAIMAALLVAAIGAAWAEGKAETGTSATARTGKAYSVTLWEHSPWTRAALPKPADDFVAAYIREKYGVDLKFLIAPSDGADAKLNAMVASGDVPEIMQAYWSMGSNIVKEFVDQGIIIPLDAHMADCKYLRTFLSKTDLPFVTYQGKMIAFGQPRPVQNWYTVWARQDWLDKVGVKAPLTIDELSTAAKALTFSDPDGNGKNDTYGFTAVTTGTTSFGELNSMFAPFGAWPGRNNLRIADGKLVMEAFSPEAKNALTWWHDQVKAGVVDPNWTTNKYENWRESVIVGKVGLITAQFQLLSETAGVNCLGKEIFAANPNAKWTQLPALQGPFGKFTNWNDNGTDNRFFVTMKAQSEPGKIDAIMKLLNDLLNPATELYTVAINGQEGIDYKRNAEGKISEKMMVEERQWRGYYAVFRLGDLDYFYPYYSKAPNDLWGKLNLTITQPRIANVNGLVGSHARAPDLDAYIQEMHMKFALGIEPLSSWDAFVQTARDKYGLDEVRAEAEAQLKKLGFLK